MMEAASTSETSVNFYQTTRRNNPENSHLQTRHSENLKSQSDSNNTDRFIVYLEIPHQLLISLSVDDIGE
jgi:hypothetical protein